MYVTLEAKLTTKVCQFYMKNISRAQTRIIHTHTEESVLVNIKIGFLFDGRRDKWNLGNGFPMQDATTGLLACIECTVQCMQ